jgi:hypothetical protein
MYEARPRRRPITAPTIPPCDRPRDPRRRCGTLRARTCAAVVGLSLSSASIVRAEPPSAEAALVVLPVAVDGELDGHWRRTLDERLYEGIVRSGLPTRSALEIEQALDGVVSACASAACFRELGTTLGASHLVAFDLTVSERDYDARIRVVDTTTGTVLAVNEQRCEMCGIEEVGSMVADQGASLAAKMETLLGSVPTLVIESEPRGATVWLDETVIGKTPIRTPVGMGVHELHLQKRGYEPRKATIRATQGVEEVLSFDLDASMARLLHMRAWGWTTLGLGLGTVVAGGVLLGIHERPYRAMCSGDDVDANGRCRFRYATVMPGALVTVLGAGLLSLGTALLVSARKAKARRDETPTARVRARVRF